MYNNEISKRQKEGERGRQTKRDRQREGEEKKQITGKYIGLFKSLFCWELKFLYLL